MGFKLDLRAVELSGQIGRNRGGDTLDAPVCTPMYDKNARWGDRGGVNE